MENVYVTDNIKYIGVNDNKIRIFEGQYNVPNGMSYNSYLIKDEKNVVLDTVDRRATDEWISNLEKELNGEKIDYLVISHLEPDHSYNIKLLVDKHPEMKIIANEMTFRLLPQFFEIENLNDKKVVVKEGEEITIGKHKLQFFMAPMVHWPEVMVTYEKTEKVLFTADGFGKFGTIDTNEEWIDEARRYYFNIVGKYGMQVQALLKKAATLDINIICPLHGPILKENLCYYINKYDIWSSYRPEEDGILIVYASIHGNTKIAAEKTCEIVKEKYNGKVTIMDLVTDDMAKAISEAFRYEKIILAASSYNAEVFPPMEQFLNHLKAKNFKQRKIGIIENGTWAPSAAKSMKKIIEEMKEIKICEKVVTIKSTMKEENIKEIKELVDELLNI